MNAIAPGHTPDPTPDQAASHTARAKLWDIISFTHAQLQSLHRRDMAVIAEEIRRLDAGEPLPKQRRDPTLATCRLVRTLCEAVTLYTHLEAGTLPAPRRQPQRKPPADPRRDLLRTALREVAVVGGGALPAGLRRAIDDRVEACLAADPQGALPPKAVFEAMCAELGLPVARAPAGGAPARTAPAAHGGTAQAPRSAAPMGKAAVPAGAVAAWRARQPGATAARAVADAPLPFVSPVTLNGAPPRRTAPG